MIFVASGGAPAPMVPRIRCRTRMRIPGPHFSEGGRRVGAEATLVLDGEQAVAQVRLVECRVEEERVLHEIRVRDRAHSRAETSACDSLNTPADTIKGLRVNNAARNRAQSNIKVERS